MLYAREQQCRSIYQRFQISNELSFNIYHIVVLIPLTFPPNFPTPTTNFARRFLFSKQISESIVHFTEYKIDFNEPYQLLFSTLLLPFECFSKLWLSIPFDISFEGEEKIRIKKNVALTLSMILGRMCIVISRNISKYSPRALPSKAAVISPRKKDRPCQTREKRQKCRLSPFVLHAIEYHYEYL